MNWLWCQRVRGRVWWYVCECVEVHVGAGVCVGGEIRGYVCAGEFQNGKLEHSGWRWGVNP
jgi:hypothetical protein